MKDGSKELLTVEEFQELAEKTRVQLYYYVCKTSVVMISILIGVYFWIISGRKSYLAESVVAYLPSSDGIKLVHHAAKTAAKTVAKPAAS
tara:strand:+ start:189 stop:458 length:270 start_codon:yes stop_codon:yes gene_type:complete